MQDAKLVLEAAVNGASVPAFGVDLVELRVCAANPAFARLVQRDRADIVGRLCSEICGGPSGVCDPSSNSGHCVAQAAFSGGSESLQLKLVTSESGPVPAELSAITLDDFMALFLVPARDTPRARVPMVHVHALGRFEVVNESGERARPRRPQALALFRLLLSHRGHVLSDAEITTRLWPQGATGGARSALRVLIYDLRHMLEPDLAAGGESRFIVAESDGYVLPLDAPLQLDVDEFERVAALATSSVAANRMDEAWTAATRALELYRGDFFEGDAPASWFLPERLRLRNAWIGLLLISSALLARHGRLAAALDQSERAARADLANEAAQRQAILLRALSQGRTAALGRFVELFQEFKQRLGVAPSRETASLVEHLRRGEAIESLLLDYCPLALPQAADDVWPGFV